MSVTIRMLYAAIVSTLLLGALWTITSHSAFQEIAGESLASVNAPGSGSEVIEGYKQWTRVNPVPAVFHSQIAIQCAAPTAKHSRMEEGNPHRDKFITVYVNDVGKRAMMQEKVPHFP